MEWYWIVIFIVIFVVIYGLVELYIGFLRRCKSCGAMFKYSLVNTWYENTWLGRKYIGLFKCKECGCEWEAKLIKMKVGNHYHLR